MGGALTVSLGALTEDALLRMLFLRAVLIIVCLLLFLGCSSARTDESFNDFLAQPLIGRSNNGNLSSESAFPVQVPFPLLAVRSMGGVLLFSAIVELKWEIKNPNKKRSDVRS